MLLHGWGRSLDDFAPFCHELATADNSPWVVRFDLPGFGSSPAPDAALSTNGYAQLIAAAIREVQAGMPILDGVRLIVIGHSLGGRVGLALSGLASADLGLKGLLLSGVPFFRASAGVARPHLMFRAARSLHRIGLIPESRMEKFRRRYGSADYANSRGVMREALVGIVNEDYAPLLTKVDVPVLLLWGEGDQAAPLEVAQRAVAMRPDLISLTKVPGDHFVAIKSPGILLDGVRALIERIEN